MPQVLSPAMLLTQKVTCTKVSAVMSRTYSFWKRWKQEYLSTLQSNRKWTEDRDNLQEGDVVLVKEGDAKSSEWPIGLITRTVALFDGKIQKLW